MCNEGLLAYNILQGELQNIYFITRKGNQELELYQQEEELHSLEEDLPENEQDNQSRADQYWQEFLEYCGNNNFSLEGINWGRNNQYCGFCIPDVSDDEIFVAAWRHPDGGQIATNVHLKASTDNTKSSFDCTAYSFLDHSLKEDCATITISLKGVSDGETKKIYP